MLKSWRARLEVRDDLDGSYSLIACSSETETTIKSGLSKCEAADIAQDVNVTIEQQLVPIAQKPVPSNVVEIVNGKTFRRFAPRNAS